MVAWSLRAQALRNNAENTPLLCQDPFFANLELCHPVLEVRLEIRTLVSCSGHAVCRMLGLAWPKKDSAQTA
jgi:hypothetical protein